MPPGCNFVVPIFEGYLKSLGLQFLLNMLPIIIFLRWMVLELCPRKLWGSSSELFEKKYEKSDGRSSLGGLVARSLGRPVARSLGHSVSRSLGRSVARSLCRSLGRSVARSRGRSVARSLSHSVSRSVGRSVARSLGRSVARPLGRSVARSLDRSIARSLGLDNDLRMIVLGPNIFVAYNYFC